MTKNCLYVVAFLSLIATSTVIPAYAEVTSLHTDTSFYKGGSVIKFSGTTLSTDPPNVTILIFDPNNKFVLLASGIADSNHTFQTTIDTSIPSTQQKLSVKGVYNATAFIANQMNGKTVNFAFSPDGSSLLPSPPTNLTSTSSSSTEVDLNWFAPQNNGGLPITGYQIERNDGNGFNIIANSQTTTYQDMGLVPNSEHAYRVSAMNSAGTGSPSNASPVITLPAPNPTPSTSSAQNTSSSMNQNSNQSLSDILQQRYAAARKLQEMLNGQTSSPSSTSSNPSPNPSSQNTLQNIQLSENIRMSDMAANLSMQKTMEVQKNNLTSNSSVNFGTGNVLYPLISLVGVGIVVTILYFRKKRKISSNVVESRKNTPMQITSTPEQQEDDHAMIILKNRLAKGEITIDEFKKLKDELSEP